MALELQDAGLQALHSEWEQTLHLRKQWCKQSLTFGQLSAQWKLQGRLQSRADIDATMNDGTTALIIAAEEGHPEVLRRLLQASDTPPTRSLFIRNKVDMFLQRSRGSRGMQVMGLGASSSSPESQCEWQDRAGRDTLDAEDELSFFHPAGHRSVKDIQDKWTCLGDL